jgi:hypothetical protein
LIRFYVASPSLSIHLREMLVVAFLSFLFVGVLATEEENQDGQCFSKCLDQNSCGVWLESVQESKSGLYSVRLDVHYGNKEVTKFQLKNSRLNLTCSFVSLPSTVQIQWMFKEKSGNQWADANCTQHQEYKCNATVLNEHRTRSFCSITELDLKNTGSYRCQTKFQGEPSYRQELR